jgi:hypothetical protein
MWHVIVAFILYYILVSYHIDRTGEDFYHKRINPKVYDIAHKYLPDWSVHKIYNDLYTLGFLLPLLTNFTILKEYLGFWIPIFLLRSIFAQVTILPKNKNCTVPDTFSVQLKRNCYDKVFSGHFSSFLLATILYLKYKWINIPIGVALVSFNAFMILVTRSHYTIDILVALVVTLLVYISNTTINFLFT